MGPTASPAASSRQGHTAGYLSQTMNHALARGGDPGHAAAGVDLVAVERLFVDGSEGAIHGLFHRAAVVHVDQAVMVDVKVETVAVEKARVVRAPVHRHHLE